MFTRSISTTAPLYIVMLGLLSAMPPLGIDMGLPGLTSLQAELGISAGSAAYTLTLFLFGFSAGPVIFGPLSDRYGRKPILLLGVALFSLAALGCSQASSIHMLLALRFIQGIGAGAAAALPAAIVRDVFQGHRALSRQSYVAMVNSIAPLVAPILGATILTLGNWRTIYEILTLAGLMLFLFAAFGYAETAPTTRYRNGNVLRSAFHAYKEVLTNKTYLLSTGLQALNFGTMFAYIASSSAVFMGQLGASATTYGFLFAFTALGGILGAAFNGRYSATLGSQRLVIIAVFASAFISLILWGLAWAHALPISACATLVVLSNFCAGIIMPNTTTSALKEMGNVAGSAAALQRALQMVTGAFASVLVSLIGGSPLFSMAATMTLFAVLSLCILVLDYRYGKSPSMSVELTSQDEASQ